MTDSYCSKKSAMMGHVDLVKRLLQTGCRIDSIPHNCDSPEVIQLVADSGAKIDAVKAQKHAIKIESVDLLAYLVESFGPRLPMGEFGYIAFDIIRGGQQDILRYLLTTYSFDINATFPKYPGAPDQINFLLRALEEGRIDMVRFLLEEGATPQYPGLLVTALDVFKNKLRGNHPWYLIGNKEVQIFRLLRTHCETKLIADTCKRTSMFNIPPMIYKF